MYQHRKCVLRLSDSEFIECGLERMVRPAAAYVRVETSAVRIQIDLFIGNVRNGIDSRHIRQVSVFDVPTQSFDVHGKITIELDAPGDRIKLRQGIFTKQFGTVTRSIRYDISGSGN
jgi:hypothetical protein